MSVSATLQLPGQPAKGSSRFTPLGGDGTRAPLGCYLVDLQIDGDASSGEATLTINLDRRYTNLIALMNPSATSTSAGPEFHLSMAQQTGSDIVVLGTMPQIALETINAAFLWYPPPIYYVQEGRARLVMANTDATEDYRLFAQIYCFHPEVTRITPLPMLQWNVPGVSAPVSV